MKSVLETRTDGTKSNSELIEVLGDGYVRLPYEDGRPLVMGSDLSVVNAARASFAKESTEFSNADQRLLAFLIREGHTAPFRHAFFTLEIKAPLVIARQWWKYVVGSDHSINGWSEASRRYITMEPEFYIPQEWRSSPENRKQGSGDVIEDKELAAYHTIKLMKRVEQGLADYEQAMADGVCAEQARLFLHAYSMHTVWRWSASLQSLCLFLRERLAEDAQSEMRAYANAVFELLSPYFPVSISSIVNNRGA